MLTFDPIEDKGWPLRAGYKVEILERLLKLAGVGPVRRDLINRNRRTPCSVSISTPW